MTKTKTEKTNPEALKEGKTGVDVLVPSDARRSGVAGRCCCEAPQPYRIWMCRSRVHSFAQLSGGESKRLREPLRAVSSRSQGFCHAVRQLSAY